MSKVHIRTGPWTVRNDVLLKLYILYFWIFVHDYLNQDIFVIFLGMSLVQNIVDESVPDNIPRPSDKVLGFAWSVVCVSLYFVGINASIEH